MTIKSITVRLKGDNSDLNRSLAQSAVASKVLDRNLESADGSAKKLSGSLEVSNDRTTMLVQSALALGPALVPIGSAAIPVLMGIATQATIAAGAVGVLALGFTGVGDSLKAVNEYALEPSLANFEKMQEEMEKLGPAGRDFVLYLQELRPRLQELQDIAQEGILPGAEEGIEHLLSRLPEVESIITNIATALGDSFASAGADLAGDDWDDFFNFIQSEAEPILRDFMATMGDFAQGFADMLVAFGPMTEGFSRGFREMAADFADWASDLGETEGFARFTRYIEENGPRVVDTLGALTAAVLALIEAAAPIGALSLPILTTFFETLAAVMDTPFGPLLIGMAAGLSAVSRSIALFNAANGNNMINMMRSFGKEGPMAIPAIQRMSTSIDGATKSVNGFTAKAPSLRQFANAMAFSAHSTDTLTKSLNSGSKVARDSAASALAARHAVGELGASSRAAAAAHAGGIAQVGLLALAMTDLDEKAGLSNTTMLALAGSMGGPWTAAAGAAIGFTMDLASANDALQGAIDQATAAIASQDQALMSQARSELLAQMAELETGGILNAWGNFVDLDWDQVLSGDFSMGDVRTDLAGLTTTTDEAQDKMTELDEASQETGEQIRESFNRATIAAETFRTEVGRVNRLLDERATTRDFEASLDAFTDRAKQRNEILAEIKELEGSIGAGTGAKVGEAREDAAARDAERRRDMADAQEALREADTPSEREAASERIADLNRQAAEDSKALAEDIAAIQAGSAEDAEATRERIAELKEEAAGLRFSFNDKIDAGRDTNAGLDDIVNTALKKASGIENTEERNDWLDYARKRFIFMLEMAGKTKEEAKAVADEFGLIGHIVVKPRLGIDDDEFMRGVDRAEDRMNGLDGKSADFFINVKVRRTNEKGGFGLQRDEIPGVADGGTVPGPRAPYGDKVVVALAPGEEVITNRRGEADRFRADRDAGRIPGYADGGRVSRNPWGIDWPRDNRDDDDGKGGKGLGGTKALRRSMDRLAEQVERLRMTIARNGTGGGGSGGSGGSSSGGYGDSGGGVDSYGGGGGTGPRRRDRKGGTPMRPAGGWLDPYPYVWGADYTADGGKLPESYGSNGAVPWRNRLGPRSAWPGSDDVLRNRHGGSGGGGPWPSVKDVDWDRMGKTVASAVAKVARPMVGDVHISGDPTVYNQFMRNQEQQSSVGGVIL